MVFDKYDHLIRVVARRTYFEVFVGHTVPQLAQHLHAGAITGEVRSRLNLLE